MEREDRPVTRILFLILIMSAVSLAATTTAIIALYEAAFAEQRERLIETVRSRARMIEAVARFDSAYSSGRIPGGAIEATLSQIREAHRNFAGFGETGEFTLAKRMGDQIVFLLRHRHHDLDRPEPVPLSSELAEPMRRALSGASGIVTGLDYRGERTLAAYEPVAELGMGLVAKIDLAEIRRPFIRAALLAGGVSTGFVLLGALLFWIVSNPLIQRVHESAARLHATLQGALDSIVTIDEQGRIETVNPATERIFGYEAVELTGRNVNVLMPEPHRGNHDRYIASYRRAGRSGLSGLTREVEGRHRNGTVFPLEVAVSEIQVGGYRGLMGIMRDITERKEAEAAADRERDLMQVLLDNIPDGIYFKDRERRFVRVSNFVCELFESRPDEVIGKRDEDFLPPRAAEETARDDRHVIATGTPLINKEEEIDSIRGETRWMLTTKLPWRDGEGQITGLFGLSREITERRRMEQELIRVERLRAIGELAAGVSHNLNNMLTTVLGPAHLLLRHSDEPRVRLEAEDIVASAQRARDLVYRLHLSAGGAMDERVQAVAVNEAVQVAVQATRPRWRDEPQARGVTIEVVTELGDVPLAEATATGLHDILLNLLLNAVDAMPEGGTITIQTQAREGEVQLIVRDTGRGMDAETRRRVFEPFFTTKMDVGTGLGLSTVYGTITSWGGEIEVESAPGEGTRFILRLPVSRQATAPVAERSEVRRGRPGKLLIVEDDEGACQLLARLLIEDHEVATAHDGREALERFELGRYDVALIDLRISGTPGDQVAREMRQADPALVTVLITGWELKADDLRLARFDFRLQKPFDDLDRVEEVVARAIELHDRRVEEGN